MALLVFNAGSWVIVALAVAALVTNIESIAMHLIVDVAPVDVACGLVLPKKTISR
jgi:hypothetical protein